MIHASCRVVTAILLGGTICLAQPSGARVRPIWSQGRLYLASPSALVEMVNPTRTPSRTLPAPTGTIWMGFRRGMAWAVSAPLLERDAPKGVTLQEQKAYPRIRQRILVSEDFATWQTWAEVLVPRSNEGPNKIISVFATGPDEALVRWQNGVWLNGRMESMAILRRNPESGSHLEWLVFADLGEGIFLSAGESATQQTTPTRVIEYEGKKYTYNLKHRLMAIDTMPLNPRAMVEGLPCIELDDGLVMVNRHYGFLWVFDEKGAFRRRLSLFDLGKDETLCQIRTYWNHERAVLGIQPTREGQVLVATRSMDAVLFARKNEPLLNADGEPERPALFEARRRWAWQDHPDIWWWLVDPKNGTVSRTSAPFGAPLLMTEDIAQSGLVWGYNQDGEPVFSTRRPDQPPGQFTEKPQIEVIKRSKDSPNT